MNRFLIALTSLLLILFIGCMDEDVSSSPTSSHKALNIRVEFICFIPSSTRIVHDNNWGEGSQLTNMGNGVFEYSYTSSTQNVFMNLAFLNSGTNEELWICSSQGIRNSNVYINGILMTNQYLIDNNLGGSNISLSINDNGSLAPGPGSHLTIGNVPPETAHPEYYISSQHNPPPAGSKVFAGWLAAIHDNKFPNEESSIEIQYFRIGVNRNGADEVLLTDQYSSIDPIVTEIGGVYNRYPWFVPNVKLGEISFTRLPNANLLFKPSDDSCKVFHLWDSDHQPIASNTNRYWMDAKIKVTGHCLIQAGMDFIQEVEVTHYESGASDWFSSSNEYQIIRFQNW